jgi:hypothetical protein
VWALKNNTPYGAERTWLRDRDGNHLWLVAVKATFQVAHDGTLRLADQQPAPRHAPEYFGEADASSLRYEADLVHLKPTTDLLVLATARAPGGRPVARLPISMRVGDIAKQLLVYGMRTYRRGGTEPTEPEPFVELPLVYEWAFGGTDTADADPRRHGSFPRNPVGKGFAMRPERLVGSPAHRIEDARGGAAPAGFGPIAAHWSPRREWAGTYDAAWERDRQPLLPVDYDERFTLCAPEDQRAAMPMRGGEPVELVHVTPAGLLRFYLPKIYPIFITNFGRRRVDHRGRLATVVLDPDHMQVQLVFQSALSVAPMDVDYLDQTAVTEKRYL